MAALMCRSLDALLLHCDERDHEQGWACSCACPGRDLSRAVNMVCLANPVLSLSDQPSRTIVCRCGKNYMASQPIVPPGGQFPIPAVSPPSQPLLALRCMPAIKPYLAEDSRATIVVDAVVGFKEIVGAVPVRIPRGKQDAQLDLAIEIDGKVVNKGVVGLNTTGTEFDFSITSLKPSTKPFDVTCTATLRSPGSSNPQTFRSSTSLLRLPNPPSNIGSVTKFDTRTGGFLRKDAPGGKSGQWETVFPIGFYTDFGGYLAQNLSVLDELKEQG